MQSKFTVIFSYAIPERLTLVLAGIVENGNVLPGMSALISFNPLFSMDCEINSVERVHKDGKEYIGLCIKTDDLDELDFLDQLRIENETISMVPKSA